MEAFRCLLKGFHLGFKVGGDEMEVSHPLFSDDTFIFCETCIDKIFCHCLVFLIWFEAIFRLKINPEKSKLIPIVGITNMEQLVVVLGCWVGVFPSMYLGLLLRASYKLMAILDVVNVGCCTPCFWRLFHDWKLLVLKCSYWDHKENW